MPLPLRDRGADGSPEAVSSGAAAPAKAGQFNVPANPEAVLMLNPNRNETGGVENVLTSELTEKWGCRKR